MATRSSASQSKVVWVRVPGHYTKELDKGGHYHRLAAHVLNSLHDRLDYTYDARPLETFFKTEMGVPKIGAKGDLFVKFRVPPGGSPGWLPGELRGIVLQAAEEDTAAQRIFPMDLVVDAEILDPDEVRANPAGSRRKPTPTFVQHCVLGVVRDAAKKRAKAAGRMADYEADWMQFARPSDLKRAFPVCVAQSQRHGYLAPGTIQVTPRGKGKVTKHRRGAMEQAKTAEYEALLLAMKGKRARKTAKIIPFPRRERMPERIAANPKTKRLGRRRNQMQRGYFYGNDGSTVTTTELKPGIYKDGAVAPICWVKEWAWEKGIEILSKPIISQGVMAWEKAECHPKFNVNVMD